MQSKREKLELQKAQIEAKLKALDARESAAKRKLDARRKIIIGGAVMAHAEHDKEFAAALKKALSVAVTRDSDKTVIADLLNEENRPNSANENQGN